MMLKTYLLVVGLAVASVYSPAAFAQTSKGPSQISKEEAAKRFTEADQNYKLQEFEKALEQFSELYRLTHEPILLFNIAQCHRQMEHLEEALKGYKFFLQEFSGDPELRKSAESRITELEVAIQKKKDDEARLAAIAATQSAPKDKEPLSPKPFFMGAAVAGGAGVLLSGGGVALAFLSSRSLSSPGQEGDVRLGNAFATTSKFITPAGDVLVGLSLVSASVGYVLRKKASSSEGAQVSLSPAGASLQVRF